jgi:YHS domain
MSNRGSLTSRWAILACVVVALAVSGVVGLSTFSAKSEIAAYNVDSDNVAIHGYDTVAYFTDGKPVKGSGEFEYVWEDAKWHFASAANRDLFAANPERYAPQYGGYCALGMAAGEFAHVDPEAWAIIDGKLYLNKSTKYLAIWEEAPEAHIWVSEHNWAHNRPKLRNNL